MANIYMLNGYCLLLDGGKKAKEGRESFNKAKFRFFKLEAGKEALGTRMVNLGLAQCHFGTGCLLYNHFEEFIGEDKSEKAVIQEAVDEMG